MISAKSLHVHVQLHLHTHIGVHITTNNTVLKILRQGLTTLLVFFAAPRIRGTKSSSFDGRLHEPDAVPRRAEMVVIDEIKCQSRGVAQTTGV